MNGYRVFRAIFIIIGVFMIILGIYYTFYQFSMLARSERITATVVDIHWVTTTENGKTVTYGYPIYERLDPGGARAHLWMWFMRGRRMSSTKTRIETVVPDFTHFTASPSRRMSSTKTRIETQITLIGIISSQVVGEWVPLKQGLKPDRDVTVNTQDPRRRMSSTKTRIETQPVCWWWRCSSPSENEFH